MKKKLKWAVAGGLTLAVIGGGTGVALASGAGDDREAPISGSALAQAEAVALAHTGEGLVSDTEVGDEESLYEVEVTRDGGGEVDVQLDGDFKVVGQESEDSERDDD